MEAGHRDESWVDKMLLVLFKVFLVGKEEVFIDAKPQVKFVLVCLIVGDYAI